MSEAILPLVGLGASAGAGFFAPEGQEVRSFAGQERNFPGNPNYSLDPGTHLGIALQGLNRQIDRTWDRSRQPVTQANTLPSSFVQQPATFSGGGLPMDIGVTGFDLANPLYTPVAPPGGFGIDINALMDQIRNGPAGPPKTGGPPPGGSFLAPGGPARGTGDPRGDRFNGRGVPGQGNDFILEQGPVTAPPFPYFPPVGQDPIVEPPEGELPVAGPPVGGPPPRTRPPRTPPGGGPREDPWDFMPPPQEPPPDDPDTEIKGYVGPPGPLPPPYVGGGEFYQMPQTSPQAPTSQNAPTTMQDALELLGFPMSSITRRRT